LPDARDRYLRQQIELGGAEVLLSTAPLPGERRVPPPASPEPPPAAESVTPAEAGASLSPRRKPGQAAAQGNWRKGAPPIPGPGISVQSPPVPLVGDALAGLDTLDAVAERIRGTFCCGLCPARTQAVPGEGSPTARMVLVGEGPGATEDETGRPFVGAAGKLLDDILGAIELRREDVFICNVVKCRPPQNRRPLPDEVAACIPYLHRQLAILRPKVIVTLGGTAAEALLQSKQALGQFRGKVHHYDGIPVVATYHPAALLRNPNWKKPTWDDVRIARQLLDQ
jgi:DNA polymerase